MKAYAKGKRVVTGSVAVYLLPDYAAKRLARAHPEKKKINRVGITATKKIGSAVKRNRAKRIIREAYRQVCGKTAVKTGFLVVLSARPAAVECKSTDVLRDLRYAFAKLGLFVS